jgi:hypothetical protein
MGEIVSWVRYGLLTNTVVYPVPGYARCAALNRRSRGSCCGGAAKAAVDPAATVYLQAATRPGPAPLADAETRTGSSES